MSDCLFCKIVAGDIPSTKVYEDELVLAFRDIAPQAPTHILVIPKAHIASVAQITAENSALVAHIFQVIRIEPCGGKRIIFLGIHHLHKHSKFCCLFERA